MNLSRRRKSYENLRIGVLAALLALVAAEWLFFDPLMAFNDASGITRATGLVDVTEPLPGPDTSARTYAAIVTDNLFTESRQGPRLQVRNGPAAAPTDAPGGLRLIGVVTAADSRIAILQPAGSSEAVRLQPGGQIAGLTLESVEPDSIVLRDANGLREVLRMEGEQATRTATADAPRSMPQAAPAEAEGKALIEHFWMNRPKDEAEATSAEDAANNAH